MADKDQSAATKEALAKSAEARKKQDEQRKALVGKPTPTQDENDRFALGEPILEHEEDGSGPDPTVTRSLEAGKPAPGYATRAAAPKP